MTKATLAEKEQKLRFSSFLYPNPCRSLWTASPGANIWGSGLITNPQSVRSVCKGARKQVGFTKNSGAGVLLTRENLQAVDLAHCHLIQWIHNVLRRRFLMIKRLTQHGNSAALIIDKPVLDLLKITMDTPLEIATDGQNLIISPVNSARREQRFRAALEAVNRRHGKTLKALAE
jgi:antitoxin MazE